MDYFKILNLRTEPFSNSPDPEFFYKSQQHVLCLQKLEIAIRLKRGLNVVIGDVGTGKTTLSRQLFLQHENDKDLEVYLLLDPSFGNQTEFLGYISSLFNLGKADSEWQFKENIKNCLFQKGVNEKKTVVLIIDEGQKLPDFCLEILREFMNYETTEHKLIQIIIFAQSEFRSVLEKHANFADRINLTMALGPLGFSETKALIDFRLKTASEEGERLPGIFSYPAYWTIFRLTKGRPRSIIQLCHNLLLSLIIQNKSKITSAMVKSCFHVREPRKSLLSHVPVISIIILIFVAAFLIFYKYYLNFQIFKNATEQPQSVVSGLAVPALSAQSTSVQYSMPTDSKSDVKKPIIKSSTELGSITINHGETVFQLINDIYGSIGERIFRSVISANPQIANLNRVHAGEGIHFPLVEIKPAKAPFDLFWIQISEFDTLAEAYVTLRKIKRAGIPARLVSNGDGNKNLKFDIFYKNGFRSMDFAKKLISELKINGKITNLDMNKTYYSELG